MNDTVMMQYVQDSNGLRVDIEEPLTAKNDTIINGGDFIPVGRQSSSFSAVIIGDDCGSNLTGNKRGNTFIGASSGNSATTSEYSTFLGEVAGFNMNGDANVCLGRQSGSTTSCTGTRNIVIGAYTTNVNPCFILSGGDSNRIVMGWTGVTNAYIKVAWTITSDARDKINYGDVPLGLDFVKRLAPKTYQFKESRESNVASGPVTYVSWHRMLLL